MMNSVLQNLVEQGLVDSQGIESVMPRLSEGEPLDKALVDSGLLGEAEVLRFLAGEFSVPFVDLSDFTPPPDFFKDFPIRILIKHRLLPVENGGAGVLVAVSRLFDSTGLDELRLATGLDVRPALAPSVEIERCIRQFLGVGADTLDMMVEDQDGGIQVLDDADEDVDLEEAAGDASIIRFVNQVLTEAISLRATDVHIEPFEADLRVRYRVDGVLQEATVPSQVKRFQSAIVSRLKIIGHLNIAEKRLPQDGRIKLKISGREIDVRISVIPMLHGEGIVLRLLDRSTTLFGLEHLGMAEEDRDSIHRILGLPHGIFLVTGPTGSGKTTTLYASLARINDSERKIVTIEDPVEYHLHGLNQIQVNTSTGLSFASGLRSILRHDPDVILVGEIRDRETADIAVQASLTGHLVFSTLHTNDAPGAVTRLVDMGIEPYLVASSLEGVLAQRLVRLICQNCREPYEPADEMNLLSEWNIETPGTLYRGKGCSECQGTGYRGRSGVFELMMMTDEIRSLVLRHVAAGEIRKLALSDGMKSLHKDGWRLLLDGQTTVEELLRVTKDEPANENGSGTSAADNEN